MRLLIDLQGCQTASRHRGIGRYSLALAQAILRNAGERDVWVLLSDLFPDTVMPLRRQLAALMPEERIVVFRAPAPVAEGDPDNHERARVAQLLREHAVASTGADVVLLSSLFEGYLDDGVTSVGCLPGGVPTAVVLYDLIPLQAPGTYLADPGYRDFYRRRIDAARRADLLLAISADTALQATRLLELPAGRVVNIGAAADARFRPAAGASALRGRFDSGRPFALHVGVIEPRKNFERLISAWARLPRETRQRFALLLVAQGPEGERERLAALASAEGLGPHDVRLIDKVGDEELVELYRQCHLFVFPSLLEGFGLPALEAMACGAVVVASGSSSLPEVLDFPAALFDATDPADIVRSLRTGLEDEQFRAAFRAHAVSQCARFSWDASARAALSAIDAIAMRGSAAVEPGPAYLRLLDALAAAGAASRAADLPTLAACIADNLPPPGVRRLLVDVSELAERDARTGIQRVVRSVLSCLLAAPPAGYEVLPVRFDRDTGRYRSAQRFRARLLGAPGAGSAEDLPVETWRSDVFLGLDLVADRLPAARAWLQAQRRRGLRIAFVVYDTLPLRHPHWWPEGTGEMFERWAAEVAVLADHVVCISRAVAGDFAAWVHERGIAGAPHPGWFHLGADESHRLGTRGLPEDADATLAALRAAPVCLVVATLEPRKGHAQTLAAFELLWSRGVAVNLVFVGKPGWMVDALVARLEAHPLRGERLFWLRSVSDEYLEAIYAASDVLLAPSEGEGFGLPIIEGARHGLPVIARNLPVFREVAGEWAMYFDGRTPEALASAVERWLRAPAAVPSPAGIRPISWQESTAQLLAAIGLAPATRPVAAGHTDPRMEGFADNVRNGWYRQDTGELLQGFPVGPGDTLVDVGCGRGIASIFAAQRGARVLFADIEQGPVLDVARRIGGAARCAGAVADACSIPFADGIATRLVAMEVLEHVPDPGRALAEFARVCAPGALVLVSVPDERSEAIQGSVAPAQYFAAPNHVRVFSPDALEELVTQAGLQIVRRHAGGFFWNLGLALYWAERGASGAVLTGAALDSLEGPLPGMLLSWADLWRRLREMPGTGGLLAELDAALPRNRVLVARKSGGTEIRQK